MSKVYSLSEIEAHHSKDSLYLSIHGDVYDVTDFIDQHPGGQEKLLETGTSIVTDLFENAAHSDDARQLLKTFVIGKLAEEDFQSQSSEAFKEDSASTLSTQSQESSTLFLILSSFLLIVVSAIYFGR
ncbi:uncharacterized protein PV06_03771 [Exophiala oligosperma]|uniref:Cytochrome b5 heme-binding domain-containing protein n=1 Tax=Exophiala oligosperma TaxID=215243 RepID=A0A0D2DSD4_9EURO|nr:uncharacterized protein PV06_03771 [Exophiala oligosperma]KIW45375.1 hypothetical protein PV06_03771 [Exophiala oligosperma]